ncbi:MAG: bile acid:sodium symporter [Haloferacaceae archaeon]
MPGPRRPDLDALRRFTGLGVVACGLVVGLLLPGGAPVLGRLSVPLVALLVFATLHGTSVAGYSLRGAAGVVVAVIPFGYLVVPGGAALVAGSLDPAAATGLLVVAASPTTAGSALVWTTVGDGDELLATVGAFATLAVAPVAMPAVLAALVGNGVSVPARPLLVDLSLMVGGGALLAAVVPADALSATGRSRLSLAVVFLLTYAGVAGADLAAVDPASLAAVAAAGAGTVAVAGGLAAAGRAISLVDRPTATALTYVGSLKNLGVSLATVTTLGVAGAGVFVVAFYVVQQLVASGLAGLRAD